MEWDPVAVTGNQCANGSGFGSSAGAITLNGSNVTPSLWTDTQVCAVVPADTAPGTATLQVTGDAGPSNTVSFSVITTVPTVTSIVPGTAGAGIPVTITGTNFGASQANSSVQLLSQILEISTWSDTQIVALVPSSIPPGGIYTVNVIVAGATASGGLTIVGAPQVTSVQWDPVAITGTQCMNGTGFGSSAGTITLNGSSLTPSLWTDTQACVVIPSGSSGAATLQVVNAGGPGNSVTFNITTAIPTVTSITPSTAEAGVPITISGTSFGNTQGNGLVQLGGQSLLISSWSDTQIVAIVPAGAPTGGNIAVNVTAAGVTVSGGLTIVPLPQVTSVQWDPVGIGGTQCANGASFGTTAGTISLSGSSLTPSFWSDTQACAVIPSGTASGAATLQVVNAAGSSNTASFAVTSVVPAVTGIAPSTAAAGVSITITGTNFGPVQGNSSAVVQGQLLSIVSWSDSQIVATVPAGIPPGGIYSVNVTVAGVTVSGGLTIVGAPQVASVQWDPVGVGGNQCANGSGFGNAAGTVVINGASLAPSLWTDTQACVLIPGDTSSGPATLQLINAAGPGNSVSFTVTNVIPAVTNLAPSTAATGMSITITGTSFGPSQGGSSVQLNGRIFAISTWSDTQIVATVPAGIPPGQNYSVGVTVNGVTVFGSLTIAPLPHLASLNPSAGAAGTTVTITGSNFGVATGTLSFNGISAPILNWSDTSVATAVPVGAFSGSVTLTTGAGLAGNRLNFGVISTNSPLDADILNRIANVDPNHISNSIQTLANFGTRNSCSSTAGGSSGIGAARDWILGQFSALPGVHTSLFNFSTSSCGTSTTLQDVVAWIPGSGHPDRLIIIGGHYDSRTVNVTDGTSAAPGANDSGSQTSVVLEAARVLAGGSYDATLVFVAWAGEEQGLLGSAAFVQNYKSLFPTGAIELDLNCDIVGGDNTANTGSALHQFRLFSPGTPRETSSNATGSTDNTSPSRLVMHYIGDWGSRYAPDMAMLPNLREDRPGRGSDHESFIGNSIPGVRFIDPAENLNHQHSGNDLFTFVTPAYTAGIAHVVVATASALARAPTPPLSFSAKLVDSDDVLAAWSKPRSGPSVDHYVVAARPVSENFYHNRVIIDGKHTSAQVRINEDLGITPGAAFFISVAAVDAAGHESIFGYPEYRCTSTGCVVPSGALNVTATR